MQYEISFKDMVTTYIGEVIIFISIVFFIIILLTIIGKFKAFKKAERPGWTAIIPIYNLVVLLDIAELPLWYVVLYFIPFVNLYVLLKSHIEFAKKYELPSIYGLGLVLIPWIFFLIIGFGSYNYNDKNLFLKGKI